MDDVGGPSRATRVSLSGKMGEGNVFLFFFSSLEVGKVFLMLRSRGAKKNSRSAWVGLTLAAPMQTNIREIRQSISQQNVELNYQVCCLRQ